jgi:GcrA cell cycle regulator
MSDYFDWSDRAVDELRTLWAAQVSVSACVNVLTAKFGGYLTRSAVIGKAHRLNFNGRKSAIPSVWTAEAVAELKRLVGEKVAGADCAAALSAKFNRTFTAKAVSHKIDGLGLERAPRPAKAPRSTKAQRITTKRVTNHGNRFDVVDVTAPAPMPRELPASDIPVEQRRQLVELETRHCRWPYVTPGRADFFFCGSATADFPTVPYCAFHSGLAGRRYVRPSPPLAPREAA